MKIVFALLSLFVGLTAWAQESSMPMPASGPRARVTTGFRASLLKPVLTVQIPGRSENSRLDDTLGMSLGYIDMQPGDFGWSSSLGYLQGKELNATTSLLRADINVGYAFDRIFSVRGGFNLSGITRAGLSRVTPSGGLQLIGSAALYRNFSLDVGYINMNQGLPDSLMVLNQSGLEVGLAGTF